MVVVTVSGVAPTAQHRGVAVAGAVREAQGVLVVANPELAARRITWAVAATIVVHEQGRLAALAARGTLFDLALPRGAGARARDAETDLKAVGARFPPGDAAGADTLVPPGVREALGARLVREATFRADGTADAPQDARTWRVELETDDPNGWPYTLVFEPVEGRLLSVVRR